MRDLLSTAVIVSTLSSTALAEQKLVDQPAPHADARIDTKIDAKPAVTTTDASIDRRTYLSLSTTIVPRVSGEPISLQGELGTRIDTGPAYLHVRAGRGLGLSLFGVSMYEVRGGLEIRSSGSSARGFGGLDLGAWILSSDSDSEAAMEIVPRFGVEVGNRIWFRGTVELPYFPAYSDDIDPPLTVTVGFGAEL